MDLLGSQQLAAGTVSKSGFADFGRDRNLRRQESRGRKALANDQRRAAENNVARVPAS